jgi:dihydropteroate synthase
VLRPLNTNGHHAVLIKDQQEARRFLEEIGSSAGGLGYMIPKAVFRCIKLKNIPARAANIIKQEMLSKGGEAAVARNAVNIEGTTDILLMGTLQQYQRLTAKLEIQPFGLKAVARDLNSILSALEEGVWDMQLAHGRSLKMGKKTLIMGILNVTPDSFTDGGRFFDPDYAVEHALQMVEDGADIIDVGGASSRPDSTMVDENEELRRILPVVKRLAEKDITLSVDTFRARVAEEALAQGAHLINDIGSFEMDPEMLNVLCRWQAPVVLMHNRMQVKTGEAYDDLVANIILDLQQSIARAVAAGIGEERIIVDPGLGFGKNPAENRLLLKRLQDFRSMGRPILIGASRKSFIGRTLNLAIDERLEGSLATVVIGIMNGADIVRVHDVKESKRVAAMTDGVSLENG